MKKIILFIFLTLSLTACNYSNTFTGKFNDAPAKLTAYSGNINRYCIALNLTSGDLKKSSFISARSLFDPNDFLKPTSFNTKEERCTTSLIEYLVGTRNTTVLGTSVAHEEERMNTNYCRWVFYKQYQYIEDIKLEFKSIANDQLVGTFIGNGELSDYVDTSAVIYYGPLYYCGTMNPHPPYPPYPPHPPTHPDS